MTSVRALGGPLMLVASLGGHLHELDELLPRLTPAGAEVEWMVAPGLQSERLDGTVHPVRNTGPRDLYSALRNVSSIVSLLRRRRPAAVISTGAAIALPALSAARSLGIEAHYIESAARTAGPSLTGRLLLAVPGVHLYTQWPSWAQGRWSDCGSVFDGFQARPSERPSGIRRVVVTLGTQRDYGFRALVERLATILPPDADILWQAGSTDVSGLGVDAHDVIAPDHLLQAMVEADLVVAHAGIGSALLALTAGRLPVLVPRRRAHGEHVDDHQRLIGGAISKLGLAVVREVQDLDRDDLVLASSQLVVRRPALPLRLRGRLGEALA